VKEGLPLPALLPHVLIAFKSRADAVLELVATLNREPKSANQSPQKRVEKTALPRLRCGPHPDGTAGDGSYILHYFKTFCADVSHTGMAL
jgi:hypothetical protein